MRGVHSALLQTFTPASGGAFTDGLILFGSNSSPFLKVYSKLYAPMTAPGTMPSGTVKSIAISPDGTMCAVAMNTQVLLYTMGNPLVYIGNMVSPPAWTNIAVVRFSPDSSKIVITDTTVSPYVWVFSTVTRAIQTAPVPGQQVTRAAWNPAGTKLALGLQLAPFIRIYDSPAMTLAATQVATAIPSTCRGLEWAPDGTCLAALSDVGDLRTWHPTTGGNIHSSVPTGSILNTPDNFKFSPNSGKLAFGDALGTMKQYTHAAGVLTAATLATAPSDIVRGISYSSDSQYMLTYDASFEFARYNIGAAQPWAKSLPFTGAPGISGFTLASNYVP